MKANAKTTNGSILKKGTIKSTNQLGLLRRWPDLEGNRPMLVADITHEMRLPSSRTRTHIDAEVLAGREQQLYLFRLQVGATVICWLADPYDLEICAMLHQWANAAHMFVAMNALDGVRVLTRHVVGDGPSMEPCAVLANPEDSARFLRSATDAVTSGLVKARAYSKIDSIKQIRKVLIFGVADQGDSNDRYCA